MRLEHDPIESTITSTGLYCLTQSANSRMWLSWKPRMTRKLGSDGSMSLSCRSRFSFASVWSDWIHSTGPCTTFTSMPRTRIGRPLSTALARPRHAEVFPTPPEACMITCPGLTSRFGIT